MNATATQSPQIDRAFAVQCLVSLLENTTKLLTLAARGKAWGHFEEHNINAIPECSSHFVRALGHQPRPGDTVSDTTRARVRQLRILGELHVACSNLLVAAARESVAPETGGAFDTKHEIHQLHDLAMAFVASVG